MSVPAIRNSRVSAASSSMVGLIFPFSTSGLSALSKIEGMWSDDVVGRASNSRMRSRDTWWLWSLETFL